METDFSLSFHDPYLGHVDLLVEAIIHGEDSIVWNWSMSEIGYRPTWSIERTKIHATISGKAYTPTEDDLEAWEFDISKAQEKALSSYVDSVRSIA